MFDPHRLRAAVERFKGKTVLVVGDLIADEYIYGKPSRITRRSSDLILRFSSREVRLGGAANASHNVHGLGARVIPVGVVGADAAGDEVLDLCRSRGMPTDAIVRTSERPTAVKTRIMAGGGRAARPPGGGAGGYHAPRQQVVRVDREPAPVLDPATEEILIKRVATLGATADAILLSDYGYGLVTPAILEQVMGGGREGGSL